MYINKQRAIQVEFCLNSTKNFTIIKTIFKNIFINIIHNNFTIFCFQISILIDNVSKEGKIYMKKKTNLNYGQILHKFQEYYQQYKEKTSKLLSLQNICWELKPHRPIICHFLSYSFSPSLALEQILKPNVVYEQMRS